MTIVPEKYEKVNMSELPEEQRPKYKIGDLVKVESGSQENIYGFYIREGIGVVAGVEAYKVIGFDCYNPSPYYIIEYKVKWAGKEEFGYVSQHSVSLLQID